MLLVAKFVRGFVRRAYILMGLSEVAVPSLCLKGWQRQIKSVGSTRPDPATSGGIVAKWKENYKKKFFISPTYYFAGVLSR